MVSTSDINCSGLLDSLPWQPATTMTLLGLPWCGVGFLNQSLVSSYAAYVGVQKYWHGIVFAQKHGLRRGFLESFVSYNLLFLVSRMSIVFMGYMRGYGGGTMLATFTMTFTMCSLMDIFELCTHTIPENLLSPAFQYLLTGIPVTDMDTCPGFLIEYFSLTVPLLLPPFHFYWISYKN